MVLLNFAVISMLLYLKWCVLAAARHHLGAFVVSHAMSQFYALKIVSYNFS